jgi:hypothetical protein
VPLDCHFPFNAAIVLQLASLLDDGHDHADSISILVSYLQKAGEQGNESAADCARIVRDFGDVIARLKLQSKKSQALTLMSLQAGSGADVLNNVAAQGNQEEQSATFEELLSWFTEGLV